MSSTTNELRVSVIIPNYNYGHYLPGAIDSVLNQTYSNKEVIVINNGSTDNSLLVLKEYSDKIKVIDQKNLGQSGARNVGLANATGQIIAFLDADDVWDLQKLEKQVPLLNRDTELVYAGISVFGSLIEKQTDEIMPRYRGDCSTEFLNRPESSIVLAGESTAIFTASLLKKVGTFDSDLNSAAGWDFFRRCSIYTKFDFVPEPLTHHRLHEFNMSHSTELVVLDMRKAFFKMYPDLLQKRGRSRSIKTFLLLEWSFVKTFLMNWNYAAFIRNIYHFIFSATKIGFLFFKFSK